MRAKGRVRITSELLFAALGLPKGIALDRVFIEEDRGFINIVVSSDAPAYYGSMIDGIKPLTFHHAEGQELITCDLLTSQDKLKLQAKE